MKKGKVKQNPRGSEHGDHTGEDSVCVSPEFAGKLASYSPFPLQWLSRVSECGGLAARGTLTYGLTARVPVNLNLERNDLQGLAQG